MKGASTHRVGAPFVMPGDGPAQPARRGWVHGEKRRVTKGRKT